MDFQELIEQADYNAAVSQTGAKYKDGIKRYSAVLPPPKKLPKSTVQSDSIKRFLEKKKAEEAKKAAEFQREKEKLLALRAQNTKSNKKAKIMASRTKDNDFSKIKLTDEEKEAKQRRENELLRKNLADKVERMKARIEMEEREKMLPRKRKRKSKNGEIVKNTADYDDDIHNGYNESNSNERSVDSYQPEKEKARKPKPPPPPAMSFTELLKIAEKRQVEPVKIEVKKKESEKLMTKRERKIMEEEQARLKRKQERQMQQKNGLSKLPNSAPVTKVDKKQLPEKEENKKPVVIHVKSEHDGKFKIPKSTVNTTNKVASVKPKEVSPAVHSSKSSTNSLEKPSKSSLPIEQKKASKPSSNPRPSIKEEEIKKKIAMPKKNEIKSNPVQMAPKKQVVTPKLDEEVIKADIEKKVQERLRKVQEKLEKEYEKKIEETIAAKFAQFQNMQPKVSEKVPEPPKQIKKEPPPVRKPEKKIIEKPQSGFYKKDMEKMIAMRKEAIEKSSLKPKVPEKPFHKNPYLDPPRRLLESQRPSRPFMKRRIESDDDEDDDDDMSDFIDDGPSQNEEDYSKYIQEIFGYDRNRYLDDDDDDIMESNFEQQMKEEVKSARLGYLEDLEEERLEMERRKKKKLKK